MNKKNYMHPVTRKTYEVQVHPFTTQRGTRGHIVLVHPISGGVWSHFVRYERGEYRKLFGTKLCPVSMHDYYPGFNVRGLI